MEQKYYNGFYLQGGMSDANACKVLELQEAEEVKHLKNIIFDIDSDLINRKIEEILAIEKAKETVKECDLRIEGGRKVGELRPYQTVGVAFMYYGGSVLLGDEVGLGKTVQVAGLVNLLRMENKKLGKKPLRYLFLTEKTSVGQIRSKMMQFTGEYVGLLESGEEKVVSRYIKREEGGRKYSVVGCHSLLGSELFLKNYVENPFDLIIVDESSILKNKDVLYTRGAKQLFKCTERKIQLNATPLETKVREFYNQLSLLEENYMPTIPEFERRYVDRGWGAYSYKSEGYKNADHFRQIITLRYMARTRLQIGAKYEGNVYKVIKTPLSEIQKQLMRKASLHQMIGDYPKGVDRKVDYTEETTPKLKALIETIESKPKGERFIIYCMYVECQREIKEKLEEKGYKCEILNGQVKTKDRYKLVDSFNNHEYDIVLTNIQRGLDLKYCDNCIIYTIDPNPQKMVQVEGRITREFDIMNKNLYIIISEGKELKFVENQLKTRVQASTDFTVTGQSMLLDALRSS